MPAFYVGGGNANVLNWIKSVSFTDHTHSYLPLSGGILSGLNQTPLVINGVSNNEASITYRYLSDTNTDWTVGPGAGIGDMTYFGFYTPKTGRVATISNGGGFSIYSIKTNGGEIQTTGANAFRSVFGNYGMIFRNDGVNCYIMPTNSGDPYGSWNDKYMIISLDENQWQFMRSPNDPGLSTTRGYPVLSETNADRVYSLANKNAEYLKVRGGLGTYHCTFTNSDIRLKKNIKNTEINALDLINKIKIRQFDWKNKDYHQSIGFVADELEELDENLSEGGGYEDEEEKAMDVKSVNTFYLQGYEVKAIQELSQENKELRKELEEIKALLLNK